MREANQSGAAKTALSVTRTADSKESTNKYSKSNGEKEAEEAGVKNSANHPENNSRLKREKRRTSDAMF